METDLIKQREERYKKRKEVKSAFDKAINLSAKSKGKKSFTLAATQKDKKVRLLDEGVVVCADGEPDFYIKKGVLQAFYDNLSDDYVGSINIGHQEFASFPFLVGQWTKKDLTLVDIGDGRKGLDVNLNLDENSIFVKELRRNDYTVGVSAEFFGEIDWENSDLLKMEVLSGVDIKDFAIVGDAGNVNSGGIQLKGETMKEDGILAKLAAKYLKADEKKEKSKEKTGEAQDTEGIKEAVEQLGAQLEQIEDMKALMERMDEENEALKAELTAKDEKLAEAEKKLSANDETVMKSLGRLKELAAKYGSEKKEKLAVTEEKKHDTLSDDGLGVD